MNRRLSHTLTAAVWLFTAAFGRADFLPNNLWPNAAFESGTNLSQTDGTPTNWVRGGSATNICQVTTNNFTSQTHALAVIDGSESDYGEWLSDLDLGTNATRAIFWMSSGPSFTASPMKRCG
jgi:hypothetical protein